MSVFYGRLPVCCRKNLYTGLLENLTKRVCDAGAHIIAIKDMAGH